MKNFFSICLAAKTFLALKISLQILDWSVRCVFVIPEVFVEHVNSTNWMMCRTTSKSERNAGNGNAYQHGFCGCELVREFTELNVLLDCFQISERLI